jgi:hypothetical protein
MKFDVTIFVEGESDQTFIRQLIKNKLGIDLPVERVKSVTGKDSLHLFKEEFLISTDRGLKNVVIFDADDSFETSCQLLEEQKNNLGVDFDYFLLPNHSDTGNLEILLEQISHSSNQFIFKCFDKYVSCLSGAAKLQLNLPAQKTKIYSYLDLLHANPRPRERDYLNEALWDLNSSALNKLRDFLTKFFKKDDQDAIA